MTNPKSILFLDTPELFDKIETGITTYDKLPEFVKPVYKKWAKKYNKSVIPVSLIWITKIYRKIARDITQTELKETSKRVYLESLCKILLSIDKYKYKKFVRDTFIITKMISIIDSKKMDEQPTTKNEIQSVLPFDLLMNNADKLYKEYMETDYIDNIESRIKMLKTLVICLNIYHPPMRLDILNMKFSNNDNDNELFNYYNLSDDTFIINNSKGKKLTKFKFDLPDNIFLKGSKIKKLINKSISDLPRVFLLFNPNDINEIITPSRYYKLILDITGKNIKQNLLRKIFINHFHLIYRPFIGPDVKRDIASRQMHSISTAIRNYEKFELANLML